MSTTVEHGETVLHCGDAPTDAVVVGGEAENPGAVEEQGGWLSRVWSGSGWALGRVLWRLWRGVSWVFRSKWRLVTSTWLMGFFLVGQAGAASADGLIVGPDLGSGGGQTVFERFGPEKYDLYLHLSDSHHGGFHVEETMWTILHAVENGLMYLIAALARGAITSMEWLLNLTLYSDNQVAIDSAVSGVANAVFWPLFGTTLAIGAMVAYGRMKREGGGSLWNDASWLIAASVFAAMFATAPSLVLKDMDDTRTMLSDGLMVGYSTLGPVGDSSAGFPAVKVPNDQKGATRQLADGMWNVFVTTPWCYANFNDMAICHDVGKDYLTDDQRWKDLNNWMNGKNGGNTDDTKGAYCPKELNAQCDWIRGQSFGRLGALLFILLVTLPLVLVLLALVLYGLMAIVGFLLLALAGVIFLLFWMIPGRPRQIGVKWLEELIGALLQSVIITTVIGSVMVLDSFLAAGIPKYGFFAVALLDLATFVTGFRMRGRLENVVGMGAGSGASPFSGYMAMRSLGALGKGLGKASKNATGLGLKGGRGAYRAGRSMGEGMVDDSPLMGGAVARAGAQVTRAVPLRSRPLPTNPTGPAPHQGGGGARPPGSRPGGGSGPSLSGPGRTGRHTGPATSGSSSGGGGASGAGAGPGSVPSGASPAGAAAVGAVVGGAAAGRRHSARTGSSSAGTDTAAASTANGSSNGSTNGSRPAVAPAGTANGSSSGSRTATGEAPTGTANGSTGGSRSTGAPAGTANGSGGGSRTATGQAPAGNSATGSPGTATAGAAGAAGVAAVRSGGGSRRGGSGSGGAGGRGEQHLSPPVRTGPARAVRRGQPTVSAPALPDRPLVSRPLPTNPTAPPTPPRPGTAATPPQRSASGNGTSRPTDGGSSRAAASTPGRPPTTGGAGAATPRGNTATPPQPPSPRPTGGSGSGGQSRRTPQPPAAPPRPPRQRSPLPPPPPTRPRRQDPTDEQGLR